MLLNSVSEAYPVGLEATVTLSSTPQATWGMGTEGRGEVLQSTYYKFTNPLG